MSKLEKYAVGLTFLFFLVIFQYASHVNFYLNQLDSVYMVENIDTTYADGAPKSHVNRTAHIAIATVIKQRAQDVCAQPLIGGSAEFTTVFERHAYAILYALAPFRLVVSGQAAAAFSHALAFVGLFFAVYVFLRQRNLAFFATLIFIAILVVHPAWSESAFGQFYPDRLFLFAGFVYITLLYRRLMGEHINTALILIIALVTASIHERAALMVGISTIIIMAVYRGWKGWSRRDITFLAIAAGVIVYAVAYMKLVQNNADYGAFSSAAAHLFSNLENNEAFRQGVEKFLLVNLPYLILAIFEWRLALVAFGAMLPNIIGSIGGAEKTGWSTHYHSFYFPFLVAASSVGYLRLHNLLQKHGKRWIGLVVTILLIVFIVRLNPYTRSPLLDWRQTSNALNKAFGIWTNSGAGRGLCATADFKRKIAEYIPPGAMVTTTEGMMPTLYGQGRILHYYPLALASVDYAVLPYTKDGQGNVLVSGAVSYLGSENRDALDTCLNARIWSSGYEVERLLSPGSNAQYGIAILKRGR
jgi:hypothetical protein